MDMRRLIVTDLGQSPNVTVDNRRQQNNSLMVSSEDRLNDIFRTCSDNNSQIYALSEAVKTLSVQIGILREEMNQLMNVTRKTEAVIGSQIHGSDEVNVTTHSRDGNNTRKVSSDVVAAVIRSIWHNNMGNGVYLPVDMGYLTKLCDTCFVSLRGNSKSDIGIILADQIAAIEGDCLGLHIDRIGTYRQVRSSWC